MEAFAVISKQHITKVKVSVQLPGELLTAVSHEARSTNEK